MSVRLFYSLLLTFLFPVFTILSQAKLKEIDKVKDDSIAIHQYENYIKKNNLTVEEKLEVMLRIATRACVSRNFIKGIQSGNDGIMLAQKHNLDSMEAELNKMLGITYYFMDQRQKAIEYFDKAIAIAHQHGHWFTEATSYNNKGAALIDLKEFEHVEFNLQTSINIMKEHNREDDPATRITYRLLATYYNTIKQPEKAEPIYIRMIEKSRQAKDTVSLCGNLIYYSQILAERGDIEKALVMSGEALPYFRNGHNSSDLLAGLGHHAKNLEAAGRIKEAYELQKESYVLLKKSFKNDLEKEISNAEVRYKTEQIKHEKELSEITARKKQQITLFCSIGVLLLLLGSFYFLTLRQNARQKIASQQQKLEAIIEGEEKERTRIAKDLHDGIVQDLTAIKLKVEANDQKSAFLNTISNDIDRASKEIRDIAYQMMPIVLREYGLVRSLEDLLEKTLSPKDIKFDFETVNIEERLSEKIEVCFYRITQELLNNVIKHSKANFVSLVISKHQDFVSLIFEDNGTGFDQNNVKKGIGMSSLSSRLEIVNGELKFETTVGSGTMAIIKIPL